MGRSMKALSIKGPWWHAIVHGPKRVENRSWSTSHRGPIALHASMRPEHRDDDAWGMCGVEPADIETGNGCIVGFANVVGCVDASDAPADQNDWACGPWCWLLEEVKPAAQRVPVRGRLGLWELPGDVLAAAR